ncbi:MAG: GAF domain-containing protein [Anaerolineae bacterium]|nr:GAF domain-containing protein [Anaerolineae bacterium]
MDKEVTRYLQNEVTRLQQENQAQQIQIARLHNYIGALADLYWSAQDIPLEEDLLGLLDDNLYKLIDVIGASDGSLLRLDPDTDELIFSIVHGQLRNQLPDHRIPSDTGIVGWVVENRETVIVNNPRQDWRFSTSVDQEFSFLTRSILCVPIFYDGEILGLIELINKDPDGFKEIDATLLSIFSDIAAMVLTEIEGRNESVEDMEEEF